MEGKNVADSKAEMTLTMMPSDANPQGNVFGGVILRYVDQIAAIVAKRHTRSNVVTASIDRVSFLKPVFIGNALILSARLNYVGKSSMEIEVKVESENMETGKRAHTGTAFVTMVALDSKGKPTGAPPLVLSSEDEKKRFREAEQRRKKRLAELTP